MTFTDVLKGLMREGLEKIGRYYSSYRGYVVDNVDPGQMQRVKLKVPAIYGDEVHEYWAFPKNVFSGPTHGMQLIPRIGDLVWVSFEYGNPRRPVYSLGYFLKEQIPDELADPNIFWFKTPKNNLIKIDDTKGEISIVDQFENQLLLNKNGISIATTKKIFMGNLNTAKEFAVLGDSLKRELQLEQKRSAAMAAALKALGAPITLPAGNFNNITTTKLKVE